MCACLSESFTLRTQQPILDEAHGMQCNEITSTSFMVRDQYHYKFIVSNWIIHISQVDQHNKHRFPRQSSGVWIELLRTEEHPVIYKQKYKIYNNK
jgi:hypothetical protein